MKAIFYKLINPVDRHTWWKREVEITSYNQFIEECLSINWTRNTQRYCYLWDFKETEDQVMVSLCQEYIKLERLADTYYLVEKMYQIGECERELEQKYKMGTFVKVVHKIGICFLKAKNFIVEFTKEGIDFYKELFVGIYFGLFKCK